MVEQEECWAARGAVGSISVDTTGILDAKLASHMRHERVWILSSGSLYVLVMVSSSTRYFM